MTKFEHWASEEAMKQMIDGWSDEMKEQAFEYLSEWKIKQLIKANKDPNPFWTDVESD